MKQTKDRCTSVGLKSLWDKVSPSVPEQNVPCQPGVLQGAASGCRVTRVSDGAAVLQVGAAGGPGRGAAGPVGGRCLAAGFLPGAANAPRAVAWNVVVLWVSRLGPDHLGLRDGGLDQPVVEVLLLARPRLHVAGVALRAAVLLVRTADGFDQWAATPLSRGQFAAGRSRSAAAFIVALDVRHGHGAGLRQGAQFAEPGNDLRPLGAGGAMRLAGVSGGAAVVPIITTHRLGQRAAAPPVALVHEAAGGVPGAAGVGVAHVPVPARQNGTGPVGLVLLPLLLMQLQQRRDLAQPRQPHASGLVAGLLGQVAQVACGAAVLVVVAAHGLRKGAA